MIQHAAYLDKAEKSGYSELKVMRSAAGWYVGTTFRNTEIPGMVFDEPGSRDTGYFATEAEAAEYLRRLEAGESLPIRLMP